MRLRDLKYLAYLLTADERDKSIVIVDREGKELGVVTQFRELREADGQSNTILLRVQ